MAESTSTRLSSCASEPNRVVAQRRLLLVIQLTGVSLALAAVYGVLGVLLDRLPFDELPARKDVLAATLLVAPFWIAARWTFYRRPIRGGLYAFAVPTIVVATQWFTAPFPKWGVGVLFLVLISLTGVHFLVVGLVPRTSLAPRPTSTRQAAFTSAWYVGRAAICATSVVALATTLVLIWFTFVADRRDAVGGIGVAWAIAGFLVASLTVWAGFIGAVYYLRDTTPRTSLYRTWRGVKLLTFFGTLLAGLSYLVARPYLATYEIHAANGNVVPLVTYEPTPIGYACSVTAEDKAFDPRSLSCVRQLYLDVAVILASRSIDDSTIEYLRDARNVFALQLASPNLSDRAFDVVESLTFLERLSIVGTRIRGEQLSRLGGERFKWLEIDGAPITREGFQEIGQLSFLEELRLANVHLDQADVRALANLWWLRRLTLENVSLGKDALQPLESFHSHALEVSIVGMDPRDLPQLAWSPQIARLDMSNKNVVDTDLAHLQGLRQLRELDLGNTMIRGPGLRYLTRLPKLWRLNLSETQVTDAEILALANMPRTGIALAGTPTTEFGRALLDYERSRVAFAEGRIDESDMHAAEQAFRGDDQNFDELPEGLGDGTEE